jgi:hypothetical protein
MPQQQTAIPRDLLELSQRLEQWRNEQPPRSRLPESIWVAAVKMAQRHGLHRTTKALRLDYAGLKKRMPASARSVCPVPPAFLELLAPVPVAVEPAECVVEWESARGRMRVAMKGVTPDWASLLRAWREN